MIVDGYVRVSQVGDRSGERFISPELQRETIERWAALRRVKIAAWHTDLDETGGKLSRPGLDTLMERIRSGDTGGVAIAYLDRLSRAGVSDALKLLEEIHSHGGQLAAIDLGVDPTTRFGEFATTVMLALARMERRRVAENWMAARQRAVARGVYAHQRPFGYRRRRDGRLAVHPVEGPIVTELFRRRAEGARLVDLQRALAEARVRTVTGLEHWYSSTLRHLFMRRVYLGEIRQFGVVNRNAHPALTDEETWRRVQLEQQRYPPRRASKTPLLRGVLRCAGCRRLLRCNVRDPGSSRERRWYLCASRRGGEERCPQPCAITDARLEPYIEALFWQEVERPTQRPAEKRVSRLQLEVERRERELTRYRDNARLPDTLGAERFAEGLQVRVDRLERVAVRLSRARAQTAVRELPSVPELRERWSAMTFEDRRATIGEVIDCVFVSPPVGDDVADRLHVCLRGHAPAGLPPDNPRQRSMLSPFDPSTCPPSARRRGRGVEWGEPQIEQRLAEFVVGRERWPCFREFQAAGHTDLWEQVERHAGERRWAARMGVRYDPPPTEVGAWPEERVRRELRSYIGRRTKWPTFREFTADGREKLRRAVTWHGGPERWAREMGVTLGAHQRPLERWTDTRMKEELRRFTSGRGDWPPRHEFDAAGLSGLYSVIERRGARERLAAELNLHVPPGRKLLKKRWTEPAIRSALDELLRERDSFPTPTEFEAAGLRGLYDALMRDGTRDAWARRYGLPVRGGRPPGEPHHTLAGSARE